MSLPTALHSALHLILGALTLLATWLRSITPARNMKTTETITTTSVTASPVQGKGSGLQGVFETFDRDRDGYITKEELRESLERMGIPTEDGDVAEMVEGADGNKDGLVDLEEFSALFDGDDEEGEEEEGGLMREAFDVFDGDRDGFISEAELGRVLSSLGLLHHQGGSRLEACKEMIRSVDVDGDGMVNFDEFKRMMRMDNNGGGSCRLIHVS